MTVGNSNRPDAGTTLAEVLVAATVCGIFFVSIFEVNAVCLRFINASKENVAAIECVQDRLEQLRNLSYSTLIDTDKVTDLLTAPPNSSTLPLKATETVTIRKFADGAATTPAITFTRSPGASVPPVRAPDSADFTGVKLVQVDVTYNWTTTLGAISRHETSSTNISDGAKK
jgi:hypothetical protein